MREIINIQVGECGNQIGSSFWDTLCNEHKLSKTGKLTGDEEKDDSQLSKIGVYFKQLDIENKKESKYVPRCVLVDLDSSSLDAIKSSSSGALFNPDDFIAGKSSATNNWAKGYYTFGSQLIDQIMDSIRKQVECCDCAQGFQMIHSLGGGTGSGLGSLILLKIRDHYPDRISATFSVFPSSKVSHVITETYNAILTLNELLELSDQTFIIHNQSLYDISKNILKQEKPKYAELVCINDAKFYTIADFDMINNDFVCLFVCLTYMHLYTCGVVHVALRTELDCFTSNEWNYCIVTF